MGGGTYSVTNRVLRASSLGYTSKSTGEIFKERQVNNAMDPHGVVLRESRDSEEHPNTVAVIIALDLTGSMGSVPHYLVKEGLPNIMGTIINGGIQDPQLLFLGVGDHECDDSPLQVGQFESNDELLDAWLTKVYLEGGGGGNDGESYFLAWYFAAMHTSIDCFEKRNKKGFLFTIGDEPTLKHISSKQIETIMGPGQYDKEYTAAKLLNKAREKYNVYHLHIRETSAGSRTKTIDGWKQIIGDNLIVIDNHREVSKAIIDVVLKNQSTSIEDKLVESEEPRIML